LTFPETPLFAKGMTQPCNNGLKKAEVSKNDVPDQKASMAVPLSLSVITGRAIPRDGASIAAAKVTIQILWKTSMNPFLGLNAGLISSNSCGTDDPC
jgi:hypothetical protein